MSSRNEERERRRAERLAAEQAESAAERRRLMAGYIVAGALTLAVIIGLVIVLAKGDTGAKNSGDFPENAHIQAQSGSVNDIPLDTREGTAPPALKQGDLKKAAAAAGCDLQLDLPDEGNTHITPDAKVPDYKTNPPTSGNHVAPPYQQADGAYAEDPGRIFTTHSLEHSRIDIQYSPDLPEDQQLEIKGVFDDDPPGVLLFPNADMPYQVATTAWTQLMGCKTYQGAATLDAIRDFRDTFRGLGPEPAVPIVTG